MRRVLLATLALIPVMANAQTTTSTQPKAAPVSTTLVAKVTAPRNPADKGAAAPVAVAPTPTIHEVVKPHVQALYLDAPGVNDGSLSYTFQNEESTDTTPKLIHVVETDLPQDAVNSPVTVTVRMMVDNFGVPENVTVEKSGGTLIDQRTLAAVNQFRFQPATVHHHPVPAEVTVDIKMEKQ